MLTGRRLLKSCWLLKRGVPGQPNRTVAVRHPYADHIPPGTEDQETRYPILDISCAWIKERISRVR